MKHWTGLLAAALCLALAACAQDAPTQAAGDADAAAQPPVRKVRFLLNSGFSGANAWFVLADERGYFREEGIEVEFIPGKGAFTAAGRMVDEGYDVGYGDVNAVIEQAAKNPGKSPVGVYMVMDRSPSVIILPAKSAIRAPKDLAGRTVTGHGTDVALNTFAQYAARTGIDPAGVHIVANDGDWKTLLGLLDTGESDGLFGYLSTSSAAVRKAGGDVAATLRFLEFKQALPEFYGSVLMVSPRLKNAEPAIARGIVNAVNRGMMEALCSPDEAIAALVRRDPKQDAAVEKGRLLDTIREDMDGAGIPARGVGGVETARMEASIALTAQARKLPKQPAVVDVFSPEFLPAIGQRTPSCGTLR